MGVSKVVLGEETLVDLTNDSVNEENLLEGATAHGANGEPVKGNVVVPTKISQLENDSNFLNSSSSVDFTEASERENLETSDDVTTIFGKIKKWFNDLKSNAFLNPVNNLLATVPGSALDATQGKILDDKINVVNESLGKGWVEDTSIIFTKDSSLSSDITNLRVHVYKYNSLYKLSIVVETKQIVPINTVVNLGVLSSNIFNNLNCFATGHGSNEYGIISINSENMIQLQPLKITPYSWFTGMIII